MLAHPGLGLAGRGRQACPWPGGRGACHGRSRPCTRVRPLPSSRALRRTSSPQGSRPRCPRLIAAAIVQRKAVKVNDFTGKRFVVTGAGTGIGAAIARRLLGNGAAVTGVYNTAVDKAAELEREFPGALRMLRADFTDPESINALAQMLLGEGQLDGLVNNAGIIDFQRWDDFSISEWLRVFAVNVDIPVFLVHWLRALFTPGASIVNIASTDGMTGAFGSIAYSASKAALLNVTKSLANLLGPDGIRVNAIAPGWINTGMSTGASHAAGGLTPLGRNGTPDEVAAAAQFLLSDDARFVTGTCLVVDGGYGNVDVVMRQEYDDLGKR